MRTKLANLGGLCLLVMVGGQISFSATAQDGLLTALQKKYPVTEFTPDKTQITSTGAVMSIQKEGINSEPVGGILVVDNKIVDGKVQQPGKWTRFGKTTGCSDITAWRSCGSSLHILKPGDKVYVTKIEAKNDPKNDLLKFSIITCDPLDAGDEQKRYVAVLSFRLPKDYLAQASPDEIQQMVEGFLAPDSGAQGADNGGGNGAPPPQPTQPVQPVQAPAPAQVVAPQTPAPETPTQTIAIGQTIAQVVAILGQPQQIIDLGSKKTYKYKDLKVIFVNGKVSDVQ